MSEASVPKRILKPCVPVIPAPVVLVTCRDAAGAENIITLSWVGIVNSAPPMVGISVRPSRHSHAMIVAAGEFGLNIPSAALLRLADRCGSVSGKSVDKFHDTGLTRFAGSAIGAPLIAECPVNLECAVRQRVHLGTHDLFLGEVLAVHVSESCMKGDLLDVAAAAPIAYAPEANQYWSLGQVLGTYGFTAKK